MFARIVEIAYKLEKKDELIKMVRQEILPILKKQPGFLELLPFVPEVATEPMFAITLWADKRDVERYVTEAFPSVEHLLKPWVSIPVTVRTYTVETSVCKHLVDALTQSA
jgi:heme-degrading monooxygenase HmoA